MENVKESKPYEKVQNVESSYGMEQVERVVWPRRDIEKKRAIVYNSRYEDNPTIWWFGQKAVAIVQRCQIKAIYKNI